MFSEMYLSSAAASGSLVDSVTVNEINEALSYDFGVDLFEDEIDQVIFQTNTFLTEPGFLAQGSGPFWYIMNFCMLLGSIFAILVGASMAYKMMYKGEAFDPLKILRVFAISMVMMLWYSGFLDSLAYAPNCIGSYCAELYHNEEEVVRGTYENVCKLLRARDENMYKTEGKARGASTTMENSTAASGQSVNVKSEQTATNRAQENTVRASTVGIMILIDKIAFISAVIGYRVAWWATIFCQQILLGILTIFGPLLWAFSLVPKFEGSWAKWLSRYLTVHMFGAMLYFVGFYILLLYDVVLTLQYDQLSAINFNQTDDNTQFIGYLKEFFFTAGYMVAASAVSMKCISMVPELAAWIIPEGDSTFSARSFAEGVGGAIKSKLPI